MIEYKIKLEPLTPIHIGSGDELEGYEYVITDDRVLLAFDLSLFIAQLSLPEQDEIIGKIENSMTGVRSFLQANLATVERVTRFNISATQLAHEYYQGALNRVENRLTLPLFIRSHISPYIPGSSLKGAIRTALLFKRAKLPIYDDDARLIESQVFAFYDRRSKKQIMSDDPFKCLKIADSNARIATTASRIDFYKKLEGDVWSSLMPQLREVSRCSLIDGEVAQFTSKLTIDDLRLPYMNKKNIFYDSNLVQACRSFYDRHLQEETSFSTGFPELIDIYKQLRSIRNELKPNECFIRLGWGTGFDGMTVRYGRDGAKPINQIRSRTIPKNDQSLYTPASRRVAEGAFPLGWAKIAIERV